VAISPNGACVLASLGFSFDRARACVLTSWESVDGISLRPLTALDFSDVSQRYGYPFMAIHRVDLHCELLRLALEEGDDNNPASLILATAAKDIDPQDGSLRLSDGTKHQADLIIGADGVHSVVRRTVVGPDADTAAVTDMSAFRFLIPTSKLQVDPSLEKLLRWKSPGATIFADTVDQERERHLVWYPCQG
jgi:salicylate hydroxylase